MMKKVLGMTTSALLVAAAVSPAFAASDDVFSRLSVRAQGHYDKDSNERMIFAQNNTIAGSVGRSFFTDPNAKWGWGAGIEYMLPDSNTSSLVFDYDRSRVTDSERLGARAAAAAGGAISIIGAANPVFGVEATVANKDETFRLGARRALEFGNSFDTQLGAYAEYSKIERNQTITEFTAANVFERRTINEDVKGWGPSFDMTGRWYPMGRHSCFSFLAGVETAFLYARDNFSISQVDQTGASLARADLNGNRDKINSIVNRLGSTVAFAFNRPINDNLAFGVKLGARWVNYTNVFKSSSSLTAGRSDYGRVGPFVELRVGGVDSPIL